MTGVRAHAPRSAYGLCNCLVDLVVLPGDETDGRPTLLGIANPTAEPRTADLHCAGSCTLRAAWGPEAVLHGAGRIAVPLPPYSIRIWEVSPA